MRESERGGGPYLQHVLHFDDAAVQDGRAHGRDLDGAAVPGLPASPGHRVPAQRGHHGALLLQGAPGDEGLRLRDVGLGHHGAGGGVVELGEHGDHLACAEKGGGVGGSEGKRGVALVHAAELAEERS